MATKRWIGNAALVAQVDTATVGGTIASGSTFAVGCNGKSLIYTAIGGDTATIVSAAMVAMLNTNKVTRQVPEIAEATASQNGTSFTLTSDRPGVPFTFTYTPGGSGSPSFSGSTTTSNSGPNVLDAGTNWSGGSAPTTSDDVFFDDSDVDVLYNLDAFTVTFTSVTFTPSFTGKVGLNQDAGDYYEYRPRYLVLKATTLTINTACGRLRIDSSSVQTTMNILQTGESESASLPAMLWKGTHASNSVNISKGSLGIGYLIGDTATVATLNVGYVSDRDRDATVIGGSSLSLTTLNINGGSVTLQNNVTTVNGYNGTITVIEGNIATFNNFGAAAIYRANDTITTYDGRDGASIDFNSDPRGRTLTNTTLRKGTIWKDEAKTVTFSNAVSFPDGDPKQLGEGTSFGPDRTYAIT